MLIVILVIFFIWWAANITDKVTVDKGAKSGAGTCLFFIIVAVIIYLIFAH